MTLSFSFNLVYALSRFLLLLDLCCFSVVSVAPCDKLSLVFHHATDKTTLAIFLTS